MYLHTIKTPGPLSVSQTCQFAERRIEGGEISYKKKKEKKDGYIYLWNGKSEMMKATESS